MTSRKIDELARRLVGNPRVFVGCNPDNYRYYQVPPELLDVSTARALAEIHYDRLHNPDTSKPDWLDKYDFWFDLLYILKSRGCPEKGPGNGNTEEIFNLFQADVLVHHRCFTQEEYAQARRFDDSE